MHLPQDRSSLDGLIGAASLRHGARKVLVPLRISIVAYPLRVLVSLSRGLTRQTGRAGT